MTEELQRNKPDVRLDIRTANLSSNFHVDSFAFKACKTFKAMYAAIRIVGLKASGKRVTLYMPLNAGGGMIYNLLLALVASSLRIRQLFHHHSWTYLYATNTIMRLICRVGRVSGTHVVLCHNMKIQLRERYPDAKSIEVLSNAAFYPPVEITGGQRRRSSNELRIGHLSNLTIAKGLDDVIETFGGLVDSGCAAKLILAGAASSDVEEQLIESAKDKFGSRLECYGPIYGDEKVRFFQDIDVFVFPTRYHNEAEPLVIWEALGHGVPVIAKQRGCLNDAMIGNAGFCVAPGEDFVDLAIKRLSQWSSDKVSLASASASARERAVAGYQHSYQQLLKVKEIALVGRF